MKKVLALICAIAVIASLGITAAFAQADIHEFYDDFDDNPGKRYDIKFTLQKHGEKGGQDGIGDRDCVVDEVFPVNGWVGFEQAEISKIGYILNKGEEDESEPIWMVVNPSISANQGVLDAGGEYAVQFAFTVDTSTLKAGSYNLSFLAESDGDLYEIGTRTPAYGDGCFFIEVTSTGKNYVEPAPTEVPAATEEATAEATEEATPEVTEEPAATEEAVVTEEPVITEVPAKATDAPKTEEKKGCGSVIGAGAVIVLAAACFVAKKKD